MSAFAIALLAAQTVVVSSGPMEVAPVAEPVLAEQRGGFRLPSGIDVALTVQTQTSVDGAVILRTVYRADQSTPTLTIFAPKTGQTVAAPTEATNATGGSSVYIAPTVSYDNRNGIQVTSGVSGPTVSITGVGGGSPDTISGLEQVIPSDAGIVTDNGVVTQTSRGGVQTVDLRGADLSVTHLAGEAFGTAITNSGSDRVIDTQTSVMIDLANTSPDVLGSSMFRVQDLALDAAALRAR